MSERTFAVVLMTGAAFLAAFSQILLKKSAVREHGGLLREYLNLYVLIGYGLLAASLLMNVRAYRSIEYRYGQVLNASSYIFLLVLGRLFLRERITAKKLLGNALIVAGIAIFVT